MLSVYQSRVEVAEAVSDLLAELLAVQAGELKFGSQDFCKAGYTTTPAITPFFS